MIDEHNIIDFKTDKIKKQWDSEKLNPRLKKYILILGLYTYTEYNKQIILTSIYRTKKEEYLLKSSGIHNCWRAIDIRTSNLTELEIKRIVKICNEFLHYDSGEYRDIAVYGDSRHRDHIHCQVGWRE